MHFPSVIIDLTDCYLFEILYNVQKYPLLYLRFDNPHSLSCENIFSLYAHFRLHFIRRSLSIYLHNAIVHDRNITIANSLMTSLLKLLILLRNPDSFQTKKQVTLFLRAVNRAEFHYISSKKCEQNLVLSSCRLNASQKFKLPRA